ncbi:MAG: alpha/beta hydrolase [Proteobacteria bacterium]|nr:alpha/beta hydrolase [Pseudomonadota bacterium]
MTRLATALLFALLFSAPVGAAPVEIQFSSSDGITVFGDLYTSADGKSAPVVLLFHQARGDARGEYSGIANRLLKAGYNILAIDQRSGGDRFGGVNRTIAGLDKTDYAYCEVYPDLEAALAYARESGFSGPLAVWGSSYSAALVFQLGAKHETEVAAILGFSPASGGPLAGCAPQQYLAKLSIPALALRPQGEFEIESVQAQMKEFEHFGVQTYVADPGVHGSSMLNAERVGASTEATWQVVLEFLARTLTSE